VSVISCLHENAEIPFYLGDQGCSSCIPEEQQMNRTRGSVGKSEKRISELLMNINRKMYSEQLQQHF